VLPGNDFLLQEELHSEQVPELEVESRTQLAHYYFQNYYLRDVAEIQ
jgi:hypothetical protein